VIIPTVLQISIGFFYASASVIIVSQVIGIFCSSVLLINMFKKKLSSLHFNRTAFRNMIKQNKALIFVSLPGDVINNFSNQLPVFFLKKFALNGNAAVGYFNMSDRFFSLPVSFMTSSISEVFRQKASKQYHEEGSCRPILVKTALTLFSISIVPFIIGMLFAPDIFAFGFGEKWRPAGDYARLIAILFFFKTVVSPISYVVYIARKFYTSLILDSILLLLSIAAVFIGIYAYKSVELGILFYSITYSLLYLITFYLSYKYAVNPNFVRVVPNNQERTVLDNSF
jgi:O-antigen/teichoic acid export membrane protein